MDNKIVDILAAADAIMQSSHACQDEIPGSFNALVIQMVKMHPETLIHSSCFMG